MLSVDLHRKLFYFDKYKKYNKYYVPFKISVSKIVFIRLKKLRKIQYPLKKNFLYKSLNAKYQNINFSDYFKLSSYFCKYNKFYNFYKFFKLKKRKKKI